MRTQAVPTGSANGDSGDARPARPMPSRRMRAQDQPATVTRMRGRSRVAEQAMRRTISAISTTLAEQSR